MIIVDRSNIDSYLVVCPNTRVGVGEMKILCTRYDSQVESLGAAAKDEYSVFTNDALTIDFLVSMTK